MKEDLLGQINYLSRVISELEVLKKNSYGTISKLKEAYSDLESNNKGLLESYEINDSPADNGKIEDVMSNINSIIKGLNSSIGSINSKISELNSQVSSLQLEVSNYDIYWCRYCKS